MEVLLLGPVVLRDGEREVGIARAQPRCVLAVLAINRGQVISARSLVDCLWGDDPPRSAVHSVHTHVSRLRHAFGRDTDRPGRLRRYGDGYLLDIERDRVDLHRSRRLVAEARRVAACGEPDQRATELLRRACELWRGTPLSGLANDWADQVREGLLQERLSMLVELYRAELRLGEHSAVIGPVAALRAEYPLAEPLAAIQMLALYRCGQHADALEVYAQVRQRLVDEIGDEPGPELRALHERILRRDPQLAAEQTRSHHRTPGTAGTPPARPAPAEPAPAPPVPAQLPPDVPAFTGRGEHQRRLDALLSSPATAGIALLEGPAGVGKTALAVHWAHRVRWRFPAGQLYADLRGFGSDPPATVASVLAQFLRALGVPPQEVPVSVDEAAARYRSLLAVAPMLVVLDNASSAERVRPLLPGAGGSFVVVTSRHHLPGLVARDGAHQLRLDVLPPPEAQALLAGLLGAERVAAEPADLAALAALCGHLPLALRIAAANLTRSADRSVASYRRTLASSDRLTALAVGGDEQAAVRVPFGHSYDRLTTAGARMFRLLGLVPGPDITAEAAAALADAPLPAARDLLAELTSAYLLDEHRPGRYRMHDLIRLFAAERADQQEPDQCRKAALRRLAGWYLSRADAAARGLYPDLMRLPSPGPASEPVPGTTAASAWLDAERDNLVGLVDRLANQYPMELVWQLADTLRGYFYLRSDTTDWLAVAESARSVAESAGSDLGLAAAMLSITTFYWHHSRYPQAIAAANGALAPVRRAGWDAGEVSVLNLLGSSHFQSGQVNQAIGHLRQALRRGRQLGGQAEAAGLANLAAAYGQRGDLSRAAEHAGQAARFSRRAGERRREAEILCSLADACHLLGDYQRARRHHARARSLFRQLGNGSGEANALRGLAVIHRDLGDLPRAQRLAEQALAMLGERGHPLFRADCLAVLASTYGPAQADEASVIYRRALALARRFGNRYQEVDSLIGLGKVHCRLGNSEQADRRLRQALRIAQESGFRLLEGLALTAIAAHRLDPGGAASDAADPALAVKLGKRALSLHRRTGHRLGEVRTLLVLADARQRTGQLQAALVNRRRARELLGGVGEVGGGQRPHGQRRCGYPTEPLPS